MSVWPFLAAMVLLALNGYFVAVEFALIGSRPSRLEELAKTGDRRATLALDASHDLTLQLAGAQLGITMASLGLGSVAEPAVVALIEWAIGPVSLPSGAEHAIAFVLGLGIVVFFHLVAGEMVPKGVALSDPERWLLRLSRANQIYLIVFGPVVRGFNAAARLLTRLLFGIVPPEGVDTVHTSEDLAAMLAESRDEGLIEQGAHDLLAGVLDFGGRTAADVLVPPNLISSVQLSATIAEVEQLVVATGHSRVMVVGERGLDDVLGFLHSKDLLTLDGSLRDRQLPARLIRPMVVVPPGRSLEDLLLRMRESRVHLALVRATGEPIAGIVTLEDLLEELVGDILDESDPV